MLPFPACFRAEVHSMDIQKQDRVEKRALTLGAAGNLTMAATAWMTYWFSNSEAILLDGNYSFIIFIGMGVTLAVSRIKSRQPKTFPCSIPTPFSTTQWQWQ
mgnify:CR=1 FL=1